MFHIKRQSLLIVGSATFLLAMLFLLPWSQMTTSLLMTNAFTPHGYCLLWDPRLLWTFVGSDTLIGLSYIAISITLVYLVYTTRHDIPFQWIFLAFGMFIIACGTTHLLDVWTIWNPTYWVSASAKFITAIASVTTAIVLPPLIPRTRSLIEAAKLSQQRKHELESANQELERLYARLKEFDDLKTQFFANISHELRTPLTLIMGPTERLQTATNLTATQHDDLAVVMRNARTLLATVNDLLDIARLEAGQLTLSYSQVDLAQLVRLTGDHFSGLARERGVTFTLETPPTLPIQVDADHIQRVLINLVMNAFKFTPINGKVRVSLFAGDHQAQLIIADNGPGVPPALRELIFERFRQGDGGATRRYGGTGLGLAIAREIIELHNGKLTVDDAPEGGAQFIATLPITTFAPAAPVVVPDQRPALPMPVLPPNPVAPVEPVRELAEEGEQALILVVEDNPDMQRFIVSALASHYRVATADNGVTGLHQALALRPDLILSDVMMPDMSGDQLVQELRTHAELNITPIILLTAKADPQLRMRMLQTGAQDYLIKPFAEDELRTRIANLIATKRARELLQRELASQSEDIAALADMLTLRTRALEHAVQARDQFLSVASHELKTPLTALLGNAQLLYRRIMRSNTLAERDLRALLVVIEQAERLSKMVNTLLDITRLQIGAFGIEQAPLDLGALLQRLINDLSLGLNQHILNYNFPAAPLMVMGDALQLEQVFHNLLNNAIKYSPYGGQIMVAVEPQQDQVCVMVCDEGIGIPADALPRLFERFYRAPNVSSQHISGMGIGLFIVKEIVELHGGTVQVESKEGQGSTFRVCLPRHLQADTTDLHAEGTTTLL